METIEISHSKLSGPQIPQGYAELKEAYAELFEAIKADYGTDGLCRFFAMEGYSYDEELQLSKLPKMPKENGFPSSKEVKKLLVPAVRLMVVGRCVNDWEEITEKTAAEFAASGAHAIIRNGFKWLDDKGHGTKTYIRKSDGKECRYNINRSAFFRCIRKTINELKPISTIEARWFEHIVWSNLYTVAPAGGGNATGKLQDIQLEASKKILLAQIKLFRPTHILFITDWDGWFDRFTDIFPEVSKTGDSSKDNVVGKGVYNRIKIAVTVRPDRTRPNKPNEERLARDVVDWFG